MRANLESRERCAAKHYGHIFFWLAVGHFFVKKKKKKVGFTKQKNVLGSVRAQSVSGCT